LSVFVKSRRIAAAVWLLLIPLWVWFFLAPSDRLMIFLLTGIPAAIALAGALLCRCKVCGKSVFRRELNPFGSALGAMLNPLVLWPEERCSRCRADLWAQR
jgi:hypothetical protein